MDAPESRWARLRRSLPLGVVGMAALVLAIENRVAAHRRELASYQALGTQFALQEARVTAPGCEVLCLGDSQMKFGFDPIVFQRQTGLRAGNLAVPGTPPPLSLALLARALEAGARPRAIVFGHMTLGGAPRDNIDVFSEVLGPAECVALARASHEPDLASVIATRRVLPSLRYRVGLRGALLARLNIDRSTKGAVPGAQARGLWENWAAHGGAQSWPHDGRYDGRIEPHLERTLYSKPWGIHPTFEGYLRRTAALAAAHDIPVFWVLAPIVPGAQARRDASGHDADYTFKLRVVLSRTRNVTVLDARHSGFPTSAFFDSCHLDDDGANRLTTAIARAIDSHLAHSRPSAAARPPLWVELDPYEDPDHPSRLATGSRGPSAR